MKGSKAVRRLGLGALVVAVLVVLFLLMQDKSSESSDLAPRAAESPPSARATPAAELEVPTVESSPRVEATEPIIEATPLPTTNERVVNGIVTLKDGSPLWGIELVALDHGDFLLAKESGGTAAVRKLEGFARSSSAMDGKFTLRVDARHSSVESFVLRQEQHSKLGQDWSVRTFESHQLIRHSLPGAAVPILVLAEDGTPASNLRVDVYLHTDAEPSMEYRQQVAMTNQEGRATLYFNATSQATFVANSRDGRSTAEARDVPVQLDGMTPEVKLRLSSLQHTGKLKVQVVSEFGFNVDDFAVRIESSNPHLQSRYVNSDTLGPERIIESLPLEVLQVTLAPRYSNSPSLYSADETPPRVIQLDGESTPTVTFRVAVLARFSIDLKRADTDYVPLNVRYRETGTDAAEGWTALRDLWQYREDGATSGSYLDVSTKYYSGPLSAGLLEVEVIEHDSEKVRWSGQVQLTEGRITPVELHFDR